LTLQSALIEFAQEVQEDFDRIFVFVARNDPGSAVARVDEILRALNLLETSPLIGRPIAGGRRELIIGRGAHGYGALYQFVETSNLVFVLAIRSQRESGYKHP
jgi:plasmid stabilization system protein ParE